MKYITGLLHNRMVTENQTGQIASGFGKKTVLRQIGYVEPVQNIVGSRKK